MEFNFLSHKDIEKVLKHYEADENLCFLDVDETNLVVIFQQLKQLILKDKEIYLFNVTEGNEYVAFCAITSSGSIEMFCLDENHYKQEVVDFVFKHIERIFEVKKVENMTIKIQQRGLLFLNTFGFQNVRLVQADLPKSYSNYYYLLSYKININEN